MDQTAENVKWHVLGFFLFLFSLVMLAWSSCASNLTAGYRTMLVVRDVGDTTAKTIAEVGAIKRDECSKTPEKYKECIAVTKRVAEAWVAIVKPAINTALEATWGVLETARKAKEKDAKWLEKMKPAVCAFIAAVKEWKDYLGETKLKVILAPLDTVEGLLCP